MCCACSNSAPNDCKLVTVTCVIYTFLVQSWRILISCLACRFWDFGIAESVKMCFQDDSFRNAHGRGRNHSDPSSYFASKAFLALDEKCGWKLGRWRPGDCTASSLWQIGADGVRLITFDQRTATVYAIRCEELPANMGCIRAAWQPFLIVEGPKESTNVTHILSSTIKTLCKHAPIRSPTRATL